MRCYASWSKKTNFCLHKDLFKKGNPNILNTSVYLSILPPVAEHLAGRTESRQGTRAKLSYGEQIQEC